MICFLNELIIEIWDLENLKLRKSIEITVSL